MDSLQPLLVLAVFFGLMYFVLIRPQRKQQAERQRMMSSLEVGDDVLTIGGMHGRVASLGDGYVDLEVTDDLVLRFQRTAIGDVLRDEPEPSADADEETR